MKKNRVSQSPKSNFKLALLLLTAPATYTIAKPIQSSAKPNIIFILADDLGFEALGCYGAENYKGLGAVKTPNLDYLAAKGMKFTNCFATPVSSPARAEFLTGKYNFRIGFPDIAGRSGSVESLDTKAHPTIAQYLKQVGYTTAVCGKWHIGPPEKGILIPTLPETTFNHPRVCGFERQSIFGGGHLEDYGEPKPELYTPAIIQKWAINFLKEPARKQDPFFLYYASPIPHVPLMPTPLNPEGDSKVMSNFPFLIEYLDGQVGEILRTLKEQGLEENTIIFFSGDNGTATTVTTQMNDGKEIKGGKATMDDTGSKVPLIAFCPGKIPENTSCSDLVDFSDLLPTLLQLAGTTVPKGIDGVSFSEKLCGRTGTARAWVHTHFDGQYFVRNRDFKLRENKMLYSMEKAPHSELLIMPKNDTAASKAARKQLQSAIDELYNGYVPPVRTGEKRNKMKEIK